jgi:hypothetical protein
MLACATLRPRHRLRAKPSAKVAAMPPPNASEKPAWPACPGSIFDIARNISAGSAKYTAKRFRMFVATRENTPERPQMYPVRMSANSGRAAFRTACIGPPGLGRHGSRPARDDAGGGLAVARRRDQVLPGAEPGGARTRRVRGRHPRTRADLLAEVRRLVRAPPSSRHAAARAPPISAREPAASSPPAPRATKSSRRRSSRRGGARHAQWLCRLSPRVSRMLR